MTRLILTLLLLGLYALPVCGQSIASVEVAGYSEGALSTDLRTAIQTLVGQRHDAQAAQRLADRIQQEIPNVVAAPRALQGATDGAVRLVFVVAPSESAAIVSQVDAQYTIEAVEVRGVERSQYASTLHEEMQKMVGLHLNNEAVEDLRRRLAAEPALQDKYSVSHRIERGSQAGRVRVVLEAERAPWLFRATVGRFVGDDLKIGVGGFSFGASIGNGGNGGNGNGGDGEKESIESVSLTGAPPSSISQALDQEFQGLAGKEFDAARIDQLRDKVKAELGSDYNIQMRMMAGAKPRARRVVYHATRVPLLPERGIQSLLAYHPKQGFSLVCCEGEFIGPYSRITVAWDGDSQIERFKGIGLALNSRSLGTRRLGARLDFRSWGSQWKRQTREAMTERPDLPGLYRSRQALAPSVAVAVDNHVWLSAGLDFTQLHMEGASGWQSAHAVTGRFNYNTHQIKIGRVSISSVGGYGIRSGARNLGSDFSYTRHRVNSETTLNYNQNALKLSLEVGGIAGKAPMFERFSLGNTRTLRGFNKYDLAPLGGQRMLHGSLEFSHKDLAVFVDSGSVWDQGQHHTYATSVGATLFKFLGMGIPLRCTQQCGPMFFVNIR